MPSRLRRHDEFGQIHFLTFSCFRRLRFFEHDGPKRAFIEAMGYVRGKRGVRWLGFVIMPEHVHAVVLPQSCETDQVIPISEVLRELKGFSGHTCKAALREVWRACRTLGTGPLDAWATGPDPKPFWKPRAYDINVVNEAKVIAKLGYVHANPVRRGLVERPEDWVWSSFRFYEYGDSSLISMDWDGSFPIVV